MVNGEQIQQAKERIQQQRQQISQRQAQVRDARARVERARASLPSAVSQRALRENGGLRGRQRRRAITQADETLKSEVERLKDIGQDLRQVQERAIQPAERQIQKAEATEKAFKDAKEAFSQGLPLPGDSTSETRKFLRLFRVGESGARISAAREIEEKIEAGELRPEDISVDILPAIDPTTGAFIPADERFKKVGENIQRDITISFQKVDEALQSAIDSGARLDRNGRDLGAVAEMRDIQAETVPGISRQALEFGEFTAGTISPAQEETRFLEGAREDLRRRKFERLQRGSGSGLALGFLESGAGAVLDKVIFAKDFLKDPDKFTKDIGTALSNIRKEDLKRIGPNIGKALREDAPGVLAVVGVEIATDFGLSRAIGKVLKSSKIAGASDDLLRASPELSVGISRLDDVSGDAVLQVVSQKKAGDLTQRTAVQFDLTRTNGDSFQIGKGTGRTAIVRDTDNLIFQNQPVTTQDFTLTGEGQLTTGRAIKEIDISDSARLKLEKDLSKFRPIEGQLEVLTLEDDPRFLRTQFGGVSSQQDGVIFTAGGALSDARAPVLGGTLTGEQPLALLGGTTARIDIQSLGLLREVPATPSASFLSPDVEDLTTAATRPFQAQDTDLVTSILQTQQQQNLLGIGGLTGQTISQLPIVTPPPSATPSLFGAALSFQPPQTQEFITTPSPAPSIVSQQQAPPPLITITRPQQDVGQITTTLQAQAPQVQRQQPGVLFAPLQTQAQIQTQVPITASSLLFAPAQAQAQRPRPAATTPTQTITPQPPARAPVRIPTPPPPIITPSTTPARDMLMGMLEAPSSFDVGIVKKGKPETIRRGLNRNDALDVGARRVLSDLSATFFLQPSNQPATDIPDTNIFRNNRQRFRPPKPNSKLLNLGSEVWVQKKSGFGGRLSSPSERSAIQFLGREKRGSNKRRRRNNNLNMF